MVNYTIKEGEKSLNLIHVYKRCSHSGNNYKISPLSSFMILSELQLYNNDEEFPIVLKKGNVKENHCSPLKAFYHMSLLKSYIL